MHEWNRLRARHLYRRLHLHLWRRPRLSILAALVLVGLLYMLYQLFIISPLSNEHDHDAHLSSNADKCTPMSESTRDAFENFVHQILSTFDQLNVTHFVCYDTLWNVLRHKSSSTTKVFRLADSCFNLCVLNEDLMNYDDSTIERRFRLNGIRLQYIHSDGLYVLKPNRIIGAIYEGDPALHPELFTIHARVHVFEHDSQQDMYRRVGWKRRVLPPTMCSQLHCFPSNLVEGGHLPQYELVPKLLINIPREGIEIQKYHYPDTWWTQANSEDECDKTVVG